MKREQDNIIRGKFRLGENAFPSLREKQEKIMKDVDRILKRTNQRIQQRGKE